jgi:acyl-CoA thioester hydrolase
MGPPERRRQHYRHFQAIPTRWHDNDVYGHVNNVVYYAFFDTVINTYLIDQGGLDISRSPVVGVAVESLCRYHEPIAFPDTVEAGLAVGRVGRSSVRYEIGLFRQGRAEAAAQGHFVHVFVTRAEMRPTDIPAPIRAALERLLPPAEPEKQNGAR